MTTVPESKQHIEEDIKARSEEAWKYVFPVRNQNYVVLSIAEVPKDGENPSAIKVYGAYSGLEEANKVSSKISKENDFFNVYVAETNAWVPIPPTREFIENVEYQEERMTAIKESFAALKEREAKNLASSMKREMAEEVREDL